MAGQYEHVFTQRQVGAVSLVLVIDLHHPGPRQCLWLVVPKCEPCESHMEVLSTGCAMIMDL